MSLDTSIDTIKATYLLIPSLSVYAYMKENFSVDANTYEKITFST